MSPRNSATAVALLVMAVSVPVASQNVPVRTRTLQNGMKIIVHEDASIPNVAMYTFYRIGSRNERPGTTGLSHFFEHMMFNGAKKYGPGEFDRVMEAGGGSNNAYTSNDVTVYQNWFPASAMERIFDLEADRIANLAFDPQVIESERGVVASERRSSIDNSNDGLLWEQLYASAYTAHPYQWPVIGWMSDIENWSMDDLRRHWEAGYSPANATMILAGDVRADEVFAVAERYLTGIPERPLPPRVTTREPAQQGERRVTVRKFAQLPLVKIGYHAPESASADYFPLKLLLTVLFDGQSSRMYRRVVDQEQVALRIDGDYDLAIDPTLFVINVQPKAGIPADRVEALITDEIQHVRDSMVSEQELEKARNIELVRFYRQIKTISGKANLLGQYEVFFGDHNRLAETPSAWNRVTREDLQRVARKYLRPENRTVAVLVPETEGARP